MPSSKKIKKIDCWAVVLDSGFSSGVCRVQPRFNDEYLSAYAIYIDVRDARYDAMWRDRNSGASDFKVLPATLTIKQ